MKSYPRFSSSLRFTVDVSPCDASGASESNRAARSVARCSAQQRFGLPLGPRDGPARPENILSAGWASASPWCAHRTATARLLLLASCLIHLHAPHPRNARDGVKVKATDWVACCFYLIRPCRRGRPPSAAAESWASG
jgi:hypothetical protein